MRYFILSSLLFLCCSCSSVYKELTKTEDKSCDLEKFRPSYGSALYTASIDILNKHMSGLLLIKAMPDSSIRTIFTNETGLTFFDFEFDRSTGFKVHSIFKKMDKKAIINTLRIDFELMLMNNLQFPSKMSFEYQQQNYYLFHQRNENIYMVTDSICNSLVRIELASKRKPKVDVTLLNYSNGIPSIITISHKHFNFTISLRQIEH
ncbi:MAG: hypothetical protein IPI10_14030 [Bacteroidetes bacterium]|nr:hypothetical protein [Bacteroidota bacterium]